MNKLKIDNIIFGIFLVLIIIPKTRGFIQVQMHTLVGKISSVSIVDKEDQRVISEYSGKLKAINTNKNINFEDLKGKVVFLNFWATWCPPCIAEMQSLQDLYNSYGKEVVFLFVTNDNAVKTKSFLKKNNYTIPCYNKETTLSSSFEHNTIPTTFIISKQGSIIVEKKGTMDWNSKSVHKTIDELLKE